MEEVQDVFSDLTFVGRSYHVSFDSGNTWAWLNSSAHQLKPFANQLAAFSSTVDLANASEQNPSQQNPSQQNPSQQNPSQQNPSQQILSGSQLNGN
jgi:hypothetical protein